MEIKRHKLGPMAADRLIGRICRASLAQQFLLAASGRTSSERPFFAPDEPTGAMGTVERSKPTRVGLWRKDLLRRQPGAPTGRTLFAATRRAPLASANRVGRACLTQTGRLVCSRPSVSLLSQPDPLLCVNTWQRVLIAQPRKPATRLARCVAGWRRLDGSGQAGI